MRIGMEPAGRADASRLRGIGRHTLAFARAVVEECGDREVHLVLNGLLNDSIESVREAFKTFCPPIESMCERARPNSINSC